MGYAVAAYAVVIAPLVAYGIWIQLQRRALRRREDARRGGAPEPR